MGRFVVWNLYNSVLINRFRKKILSSLGRSLLGFVDMKFIRLINILLTVWGIKGLMLFSSNWVGVFGWGFRVLRMRNKV